MMKKIITVALSGMIWSATVWAAGTEYRMRVDGLACPYCAYGIEKKLEAVEGVGKIDVNLDDGLVIVEVAEGVSLTEPQMKTLFQDAGFTYRSMTTKPLEESLESE